MLNTTYLPIDRIRIDKDIEQLFPVEEEDLQTLRESIAQAGILVPLLVKQDPDQDGRHLLLSGHCRLRIARELGLTVVPCRLVAGAIQEITAIYDNVYRRQLPAAKVKQHRKEAESKLTAYQRPNVQQAIQAYFLQLLEDSPLPDAQRLIEALWQKFKHRVKPDDWRKYLSTLPDALDKTVASAQVDRQETEAKLAEAKRQLAELQERLADADCQIFELKKQLKRATTDEAVKELQKDLDEAHRHRVDFSKKLAKANTELDTLKEQLEWKTKRLQVLEQQAEILTKNERYWREQWEAALNRLIDPELVGRDLVHIVDTLEHLREMVEMAETWPEAVLITMRNGLQACEEEFAKLRALYESHAGTGERAVPGNGATDHEAAEAGPEPGDAEAPPVSPARPRRRAARARRADAASEAGLL